MKNGTGVMASGGARKKFLEKQGAELWRHVLVPDWAHVDGTKCTVGGEGGRDRAVTSSKQRDILLKSIEVRRAKEFLKAQGRPSDVYVEVEGESKKATRKTKETTASKSREASTSKPKAQASKPKANPSSSQPTSQPKVAKTLPTKTPSKSKPFVAVPSTSKPTSSTRRVFKSKAVIDTDEEDSDLQILSVKRPKAPSSSSSSASSSDEEPIAKKPRIATREASPMQGVESQTQVTIPGSPVIVAAQPTPPDSSSESDSESDSDKDDAGDKKSDTDSDDGKPSNPFVDDIAEEAKEDEESEETEEEDEDAEGAASEETRPFVRARSSTAVSVVNPHYNQEERTLYGDNLRQRSTRLPSVLPPPPTLSATTRRLSVGWVHPLAFPISGAVPPSRLATLRKVANKQHQDASGRIEWQRQKVAKWASRLERSMIAAEVNKNYSEDIDKLTRWQRRNKVDLDFLKTYDLVEEYTVDVEDLENAPADP
ncbi:hypothetical protein H0H93_011454, partial [Arthromyces matolae]